MTMVNTRESGEGIKGLAEEAAAMFVSSASWVAIRFIQTSSLTNRPFCLESHIETFHQIFRKTSYTKGIDADLVHLPTGVARTVAQQVAQLPDPVGHHYGCGVAYSP